MKNLQNKTAVITGGASGIGRAMADRFATAGMKIAIVDIEEGPLEAAAKELRDAGAEVLACPVNVGDGAAMDALAQDVLAAFGAVHVVCNNAGVLIRGNMLDADRKDWNWILGVNLWGVINGVRAFVPRMRDSGEEGHIVNTASEAGHFAGDINDLFDGKASAISQVQS